VVGNEYLAKLYTAADRFLHRRSDTSLVRVVIPVLGREAETERAGVDFVRAVFPQLLQILPQ
jgi:hypothetical protein